MADEAANTTNAAPVVTLAPTPVAATTPIGTAQTTALTNYANTLRRWALHDCRAFLNDRSNEEMIALWERWRGTRGKPVTVAWSVTQESLDASWTSFVGHWKMEPGFAVLVAGRETQHQQRALGPLREEVCSESWTAD